MDLSDILESLSERERQSRVKRTPILLASSHSDIAEVKKKMDLDHEIFHKDAELLETEFRERVQFLEKKHNAMKDSNWNRIYALLKEKGLYPQGYEPRVGNKVLGFTDDVLFLSERFD